MDWQLVVLVWSVVQLRGAELFAMAAKVSLGVSAHFSEGMQERERTACSGSHRYRSRCH